MEPIRVIGRVDLAQQIHAALLAEGADARLATAAPMAVVADTGRDGTGIDVLANAFETCSSIKKAAQGRPVVMVTFEEGGGAAPTAEAYVAQIARTSRGPDAHLPWPATGVEILAACELAREAARIPRPRFTWRLVLPWFLLVGIAVAGTWAMVCVNSHGGQASGSTVAVASAAKATLFGFFAWQAWRRRVKAMRVLRLFEMPLFVLLAVWSLVEGFRALLR